jgi:Uma2 family endonuclease
MNTTAVSVIPETAAPPRVLTVADLVALFGPISMSRIGTDPRPGQAPEQDVLDWHRRTGRLFELVDGVLLEKVMGYRESVIAGILIRLLGTFIAERGLGVVAGEAGMMRLTSGRVRMPDVSFVSWDRFPGRSVPAEPIPELHPDLAIEVLSESNTPEEMEGKRRDYFGSGTRLVWEIDPEKRTAKAYTAVDQFVAVPADGSLDGAAVLPGFTLSLAALFAELAKQSPPA